MGALIGYAIPLPFLTPAVLSSTLAFVAGVMVYISLDEILPIAYCYSRGHLVTMGVVTGMLVMVVSLFLLPSARNQLSAGKNTLDLGLAGISQTLTFGSICFTSAL